MQVHLRLPRIKKEKAGGQQCVAEAPPTARLDLPSNFAGFGLCLPEIYYTFFLRNSQLIRRGTINSYAMMCSVCVAVYLYHRVHMICIKV